MERDVEREQIEEIRGYIERGSTAMAEGVYSHPTRLYLDPERQTLERETLFTRFPLMLAPSGCAREPGDFFTLEIAGTPVIVVRGDDGTVRTLVNICRHRGNRVCHESGGRGRRMFSCNYHAWTYDREGRLWSFVDSDGFRELDKGEHGLAQLPTEERHGLIWCRPESGAQIDVAAHLGAALDAELAAYDRRHDMAGMTVYGDRTVRDLPFNWKLAMDTYHEASHLTYLHKESVGALFLGNLMTYRRFGLNHRHIATRASFPEMVAGPSEEQHLFPHAAATYFMFPNSVWIWNMDHAEMYTVYPDPKRHDRCTVQARLMVVEPPQTEGAERHWRNMWQAMQTVVFTEDFAVMTDIQANIESGRLPELRFGRNEPALQDFHRNIGSVLETARPDDVPVGT